MSDRMASLSVATAALFFEEIARNSDPRTGSVPASTGFWGRMTSQR